MHPSQNPYVGAQPYCSPHDLLDSQGRRWVRKASYYVHAGNALPRTLLESTYGVAGVCPEHTPLCDVEDPP